MEMEQHRPYAETIPKKAYQRELHDLQVELVKLQKWVVEQGERIVIVFEGRDAAGKGGAIPRFSEYLNPRRRGSPRSPSRTTPSARSGTSSATSPPPRRRRDRPVRSLLVQPRRRGARHGVLHPRRVRRVLPPGPRRSNAISFDPASRCSSCGSRCPETSSVSASTTARPIRCGSGSSRRWTSRRSAASTSTAGRATRCCPQTDHEAPWTVMNSNDKRRARLGAIRHVLGAVPYHHRRDDVVGTPDAHVVVPAALAMRRVPS